MSFTEALQNGLNRILPQRRKPVTLSSSLSGGIGNGVVRYEDDMIISKPAIIFHTSQIFFNFLSMACFASVASFQAKWGVGPSGLSGFALFVSVAGIFLSAFMLFVPVIYEKYDKFESSSPGVGCTFSLLIANDPHASLGSDYVAALPSWCSTKKAGCIFFWLAFGFWLASLILLIIDWRSGNLTQRPKDTPDQKKTNQKLTAYRPVGSVAPPPAAAASQTTTAIPPVVTAVPRLSTYDNSNAANSPFRRLQPIFRGYSSGAYRDSGYSGYATPPAATSRHSLDAYGAFSDPAPTGFGGVSSSFATPPTSDANAPRISRTMQYADPYAAVRASITPRW
ncbi:hypothetical protein EV401DRAFT_1927238 [Pisolithus croceorrhizus]|nr:hypothetical protein EV401DRAFT_1927238 [Pisolithus croceorrhizus]